MVVPPFNPKSEHSYIEPGGTSSKSRSFSRTNDIRAHRRAIYVFGRIEYFDAFNIKDILVSARASDEAGAVQTMAAPAQGRRPLAGYGPMRTSAAGADFDC